MARAVGAKSGEAEVEVIVSKAAGKNSARAKFIDMARAGAEEAPEVVAEVVGKVEARAAAMVVEEVAATRLEVAAAEAVWVKVVTGEMKQVMTGSAINSRTFFSK